MSGDREIMMRTLKKISAGDQSGRHVSAAHYAWMANAFLNCEVRAQAAEAAIKAIVTTAGGIVDGNPTGPHNVLQRIRELVALEMDNNQSFDRTEYQRQYMRDMRAARKAGMSTADYRNQRSQS